MKIIIENEEDYEQGLLMLDAVMSVAKDEEGEPLLPIIDIIADAVTAFEDRLPSVQAFERSVCENDPEGLSDSELFALAAKRVKDAIEDTQSAREHLAGTLASLEHYYAVFTPVDGGWLARFPDVPSAVTEGKTVEEALDMAVDVLSGILATGREGREYFAPRSFAEIAQEKEENGLVLPVSPNKDIMAEYSHQEGEDLADTLIKTTKSLISRIDQLEKRLDVTHALLGAR